VGSGAGAGAGVDVDVDGQSEVRPITTEIRIESLEPSKLATAFG